jgi:hypothetical protein
MKRPRACRGSAASTSKVARARDIGDSANTEICADGDLPVCIAPIAIGRLRFENENWLTSSRRSMGLPSGSATSGSRRK